jgi:hypothetical protein
MFTTSNRCNPVENTLARSGVVSYKGEGISVVPDRICVVLYLAIDVHKFVSHTVINRKRYDQWKQSDNYICDGIYVLSLQASPEVWDHHVRCQGHIPE